MAVGAFSLVFMSASIPGDFAYVQDVLGVKNIRFGSVGRGMA
jgi:hypothetical protein